MALLSTKHRALAQRTQIENCFLEKKAASRDTRTIMVADDEATARCLPRSTAAGRAELFASHRSIRNKGSDEVLGGFR
jgi:hypothetical protein